MQNNLSKMTLFVIIVTKQHYKITLLIKNFKNQISEKFCMFLKGKNNQSWENAGPD